MDLDLERIYDRKEAARAVMKQQMRADEIKAELCNIIREETPSNVQEKIMRLRTTDPDLYVYIVKLQTLQRQPGGAPGNGTSSIAEPILKKTEDIKAHIDDLEAYVNSKYHEIRTLIDRLRTEPTTITSDTILSPSMRQ